jgi:hypothetical protein
MNQQQAAKDLVLRARHGDQNAMAILDQVGKNARAGSLTAINAYQYILDFIQKNPGNSGIGSEAAKPLGIVKAAGSNEPATVLSALCSLPEYGNPEVISTAVIFLANACLWNKQRVSVVDSVFAGDPASHQLWRSGYLFSGNKPQLDAACRQIGDKKGVGIICAGHCIGSARKLQLARLPNVPLSVLGPNVGFELGCR